MLPKVLIFARIGLIFFMVASMILRFGFVQETVEYSGLF